MKMRRGRVDKNSQKIYLVCKVCKESQLFKNFKFLEVVSWKVLVIVFDCLMNLQYALS